MSMKTKTVFQIASKLPPDKPLTQRELDIIRWTIEYMAQHFIDVIEDYDEEKAHKSTYHPN